MGHSSTDLDQELNQDLAKQISRKQMDLLRRHLLGDGLNSSSTYQRNMELERQLNETIAESPFNAVLRGFANFSKNDWQKFFTQFAEALEAQNHAEKSDLAREGASMLLIKLIEILPAEQISQLIQHFQPQLASETDADQDEAINSVIESLKTSPGKDPRLYRSALQLFLERKGAGVYFDELKKTGINAQDEDAAVRKLVHRLDEKLRPHGYKVRRRSVYDIAPIDEDVKE